MAAKEHWGTRIGVIMAVAGSAVGLGNFLRFPGQAALNGGGAFMIPYFISLLILGIPICWAEWTMGRYGGRFGFNSCPAIMGVLGRRPAWRYIGVLGVLIPIVILMYYMLVEAWCLGYAWYYLTGQINLGSDPSQYGAQASKVLTKLSGMDQDGAVFVGGLGPAVIFWFVTFVANFVVIYRGVSKGIEQFCNWAMPLMALCAILVLLRVLTLPPHTQTAGGQTITRTVTDGLGFMWNPNPAGGSGPWWQALTNPSVWLAAASQIFFTLSVGFGVILNYASYLRRNDDVVLSGLTASATNELFEVCFGGLITIPAAFLFLGVLDKQVLGSSFALGFNTLPVVFQYMPLGRAVGFLWFFMLFLAAITSSLSMLQPAIAFLEEGLGIGRRASVTLLGLISVFGSLFTMYFSRGLTALDTLDFWAANVAIFVMATLLTILFGWVYGAERGYAEARRGAELRVPRVWKFVIKYVSPTYLLVIFAFWCWHNLGGYLKALRGNQVALFSVLIILALLVFLLILVHLAARRWGDPRGHVETLDAEVSP